MEFTRRLMMHIGIYSGIIIIFLVALFFLSSDIDGRVKTIEQLHGELEFWSQSTDSLASLKQDEAQANQYASDLQNIVPSRDQLLIFFPDLNSIAKQNSVNVSPNLGVEEQSANSKLGATNFDLVSVGSFPNLMSFLKSLQASRYPIKFTNLEMLQVQQGQKDEFKISLSGKVFYY